MNIIKLEKIKDMYLSLKGDSIPLFTMLQDIDEGDEREEAYRYLEQCVIEKRLAWVDNYRRQMNPSDNSVWDAFEMFYLKYLRLTIPKDGKIVDQSDGKIVSRWWNFCPTLNACIQLNLDTRILCKQLYELPVQKMIQQIHPQLIFSRNYKFLRPHAPFCEEIISFEE